jgi:hypothetical protein
MANTTRYVDTINNNSGLIPQSQPSSFPLFVSTNAYQNLSKLIQKYEFNDTLYNFYSVTDSPMYILLQTAFMQQTSVQQLWGYDLETTFTVTFLANQSMTFDIQWLDVDGNEYHTLSGTAANLAALVTYINTNITTVTASVSGLVLTIEPNEATPDQLVRINFTNLEFDEFVFAGSGVPASEAGTFNAILSLIQDSTSFYTLILESTVFFPLLADSSAEKIASQLAMASAVEATQNAGDNRKVIVINTQDPANLNSDDTGSLMYQAKALEYQRSMVVYFDGPTAPATGPDSGLCTGITSLSFGQTNGNASWAEKTVKGIVPPFLSEAQLDALYNLDSQGNLDPDCLNGNYYTAVGGITWFYPGVTPSALPFDVTILSDNIAKACRYAQINALNKNANLGTPVPYNQVGINLQVSVIRNTVNSFAQYLSPVDAAGNLCTITAPTFAEIQANPQGQVQFTNRVLTGIQINFVPAGSINKIVETFFAII